MVTEAELAMMERLYFFDKLREIERLVTSPAYLVSSATPVHAGSPVEAAPAGLPSTHLVGQAGDAEELAARIREILYRP